MNKSSGGAESNPFFNLTRKVRDDQESTSTSKIIDEFRSSKSNINNNNSVIGRLQDNNITGGHLPEQQHDDTLNYALLIALYTLQGIPMGLSASIPFLIQQKVKVMADTIAATSVASSAVKVAANAAGSAAAVTNASVSMTKMAYNAQAIFALCSWPFSLKLLWAPIVDAVYFKGFGRRKSWLVPVQLIAAAIMIFGSNYVETQLGLGNTGIGGADMQHFDVKGVTAFFFVLYFLMATQDIAVDGWALTMLSRKNRGRGPVCNSIGQNLGYFLAFVGFLALNDTDSSEKLWRPLLGLKSDPTKGLVSLGGFIKFMGCIMLIITTLVAVFKKEENSHGYDQDAGIIDGDDDDDAELDASQIGLAETYHRLWSVCKLPSVRMLFVILLTYRLPTALSDKVKFLKAVEFGMSKQTTALLAPTIILPLGIAVPIIATKIWKNHPLKQFMTAYKLRVTLVPFLDVCMLLAVRSFNHSTDLRSNLIFWTLVVSSTALFSIVDSMQFNSQMTFFAHRVDPAIGGSYMTLLNTAANLGGTWPASIVMFLVGQLSVPPTCETSGAGGEVVCSAGREAYFPLQMVFSALGCLWIYIMGKKVMYLSALPDDAWRTHSDDEEKNKDTEKGK
jgi:PAT family acetyl-CoA transporter-like MFS transporter 1